MIFRCLFCCLVATLCYLLLTSCSKEIPPPPHGMVLIPEGEFIMGFNEGAEDEKPEHKVFLRAFYIDEHEVTNAEYAQFDPSHEGRVSRGPNMPVTEVSYEEALAYCRWRTQQEHRKFRLPTEAEWERAARGKENSLYAYGDIYDKTKAKTEDKRPNSGPEDVKRYEPNSFGLYDMTGNVAEWVLDCYDANYYKECANSKRVKNPKGPGEDLPYRVIRGGSYKDGESTSRATARRYADPKKAFEDVGFRCVSEP